MPPASKVVGGVGSPGRPFIIMGWRSDWLYRLVFAELAGQWQRARADAVGPPWGAEPPEQMAVSQCEGADVERALCLTPVMRRWVFDAKGVCRWGASPPAPDAEGPLPPAAGSPGPFYRFAQARFHITPDRRRVVITSVFGPRYGRGAVFNVIGQGRRGRLAPAAGWQA